MSFVSLPVDRMHDVTLYNIIFLRSDFSAANEFRKIQ